MMDIIYITSACSQTKFEEKVSNNKNAFAFQNQKFHNLLIKGLSEIQEVRITVVSTYPVDRSEKIIRYEEEVDDKVRYIYPSYYNIPILHRLGKYINTRKIVKKSLSENTILVCNVLDYDMCLAVQSIRNSLPNLKIVGIVTDIPQISSGASFIGGNSLKAKFSSWLKSYYNKSIFNYDAFLFLAEPMNNIVNEANHPFCVIEGFSDIRMQDICNKIEEKSYPKVLLYAGGLHVEYGIKKLVEAFDEAKVPEWELHIYGNGNYKETLLKKCDQNKTIKYYGVKPNNEVVDSQIKASLLVNPRPTKEEFVKYSFPSKTMECMASGTPLLTTHLPSMPQEYNPFVYFIEDETDEGFVKALRCFLTKKPEELHIKGCKAKQFVLAQKSNVSQAKKFYEFLKCLR